MMCDLVAVGTRAWQAGASKAGRAQSTPGFFVCQIRLMATPKEDLVHLLLQQPDDSSREELVRELAFSLIIERCLLYRSSRRPDWCGRLLSTAMDA
jgi:hypothetical protein